MKYGWMTVVLLVVGFTPVHGQADPELDIGLELYNAGKYGEALGFFKAVLAVRPRKEGACLGAGRCLVALGRYTEALEVLRKVEDQPKPSPAVFHVMAQALYWEGIRRRGAPRPGDDANTPASFFLDASIQCSKAVRLHAKFHEAYYTLGLIKLQAGAAGAAAAEKAFEKAVALKPDQPSYLQGLGLALQFGGKLDKAVEAYERTLRITPESFKEFHRDTNARAGFCYARLDKWEQAGGAFGKAFALAPLNDATFQTLWAAFGNEENDREHGVKILRTLAGMSLPAALPHFYLGYFHQAMGDSAGARKAWEACVKTPEGARFPEAWARIAGFLINEDKKQTEAVKCCEKALALDASNRTAFVLLQVMVSRHFAARKWIQAENLTRRILDFRPGEADQWSNLGLFLSKQNRLKEAWYAFKEALKLAPDNPQILNSAGGVLQYGSLGPVNPMKEAEKLYERALKIDPNCLDAMENLATILAERGEYKRAEKLLETVVERQPGRGVSMRVLNMVRRKMKALAEKGFAPGGK